MRFRLLSALALAGALLAGWFVAPASAVSASPTLAQTAGAMERASAVTEAGWRHNYHREKFRRHLRRKLLRSFGFRGPDYRKRHHYRKRRDLRGDNWPRNRKREYRRHRSYRY